MKRLRNRIRQYISGHRTRKYLRNSMMVFACIITFITTYTLILPALTLEKGALICGMEVHEHTENCYDDVLICTQQESAGHTHGEECYYSEPVLICEVPEHVHAEECFDEEGNLICEWEEHEHDENCYDEMKTLTCTLEESEGHIHDASCYEKQLVCGMEYHVHTQSCYEEVEETPAPAIVEEEVPGNDLPVEENVEEPAAEDPMGGENEEAGDDIQNEDTADESSEDVYVLNDETETDEETEAINENNENNEESSEEENSDEEGSEENTSDEETSTEESTEDNTSDEETSAEENSEENTSDEETSAEETSGEETTEESSEETALPAVDFARTLTDTSGLWILRTENVWEKVDENTSITPSDYIMVRMAYNIPAGSLDAGNAMISYPLPKSILMDQERADYINNEQNYLNQIISGSRLPEETLEQYSGTEYLAGKYVVGLPSALDETLRTGISGLYTTTETSAEEGWNLVCTFNEYSVYENATSALEGWLMFYVTGAELATDENGWGSIVFSENDETGEKLETVYRIGGTDETENNEESSQEALEEESSEENSGEDTSVEETSEEASGEETSAEENSEEETSEEETSEEETSEEETSEEAEETSEMSEEEKARLAIEFPAQTFEQSTGNVTVTVYAGTGAFPAGTTMFVEDIDDEDTVAAVVDAVNENADTQKTTEHVLAADITFYDKDGQKIEPLIPIHVVMTPISVPENISQDAVPVIVHVDDAGNTEVMEQRDVSEVIDEIREEESSRAESYEALESENESRANDNNNGEQQQSKDEVSGEDGNDNGQNGDGQGSDGNDQGNDSQGNDGQGNDGQNGDNLTSDDQGSEDQSYEEVSGDGGYYDEVTGETVTEASVEDILPLPNDAIVFDADSFSIYAVVYTVDFHWEVDGQEFVFSIPGGGFVSLEKLVEVLGLASTYENTENGTENNEDSTENAGLFKEEVLGVDKRSENEKVNANAADDETSRFVDSTAYEEVRKMNEVEISETTKNFVANVDSVSFSNKDALWICQVGELTKVSELKEKNKLEVRYSSELTVKDISRINAQTVDAGDWALISVRPFETDETLSITMKDGNTYTIRVAGQPVEGMLRTQYASADGTIVVTAVAPVGTLPEGTRIHVRDINPFALSENDDADEEMQLYSESLSSVANMLWQDGRKLCEGKVVDISFIDANGKEIEPNGYVDVALLMDKPLNQPKEEAVEGMTMGLAHIPTREEPELESLENKTQTNEAKLGNLENEPETHEAELEILEADIEGKEVVFTSDSFSIYVTFGYNTSSTQDTAPVNLDIGWIRFGGNMQVRDALPNGYYNFYRGINPSPEGSWRWLTINLFELKDGVSEDGYNVHENYNQISTYKWLAGDTDIVVEDYDFMGRDVLCTVFYPTDEFFWGTNDPYFQFYDAKNGTDTKVNYGGNALGHDYHYEHWYEGWWDVDDPNVLNIYLSREREIERVPRTDYVVRYYHADGTYDTVSGYLSSDNTTLELPAYNNMRSSQEVYSGMTIGAGHSTLSADINNGRMTINFNEGVSLVKASVYYKENVKKADGSEITGTPQYDAAIVNGKKTYDTKKTGLHTDKTATPVTDSVNAALNDGRTFNLTLETWNVGNNYANVGMVLDASGSMVWPSNEPEPIKVSTSKLGSYLKTTHTIYNGSSSEEVSGYFLTQEQVNNILNINYTDNSKLGYNGYRYYIKDPVYNVNEYVPLGYYDGSHANGATFANVPANNATKGWYYVTSSTANNYKNNGTAKQYSGFPNQNSAWKNSGSTASQFWLDDEGVLHAYWYRSGKLTSSSDTEYRWNSVVYASPIDADDKSEVLQYGISRFAAILNANSPTSQVAMTRFSRARKDDYFKDAELALLNWTSDTKLITSALNQQYDGGTSTGKVDQNGLNVYNYGFTGDTSTASGINAFIQDLTDKTEGSYAPTKGNTGASKYLIIFTDGKDTDKSGNYLYDGSSAKGFTDKLKAAGYTIFTVMMQSAGMTSSDVSTSENFLRNLSGKTGEDGWATINGRDKYYFNFMYNNPSALVQAFQNIAKEIAKPLEDYIVRDYIDPRFDLLDAEGNIRTRLNRDGIFMPVVITLTDGKRAMLKYDSNKKMFYVEVEKQSIPTSPQNSEQVTVNTTVLTVRAKDDFIGGNDILSNGNEAGQNQVFKPVDNYAIEVNEPVAANSDTSTYPKKDFPKTSTNPATYGTTLLNYEDTIFLNETITPIDLFEQVSTMDDETADDNHLSVYVGYLSRAGKKLHNDENYYINILQNGVLPSGHQNINGEVITITDKVVTIQLPYYYLKNENDNRSYAGGDLHQADKVGTITYTWKAIEIGEHTLTDNNAFKDYMSTTLDTVKYQLSMSYTPDPVVSNDNIANNGSARTLALTNQTGSDKLIRDPVGNAAASQSTDITDEGFAVVHVVAGKIGITKKIAEQDLDDKGIEKRNLPSVTFAITKDGTAYKTITADMSQATLKNGYYEFTAWETDLPKGIYSVSEVGGEGYKLDSFEASTIQDDSSTITVNESQFAAKYSTDSDAKTVTWYIGPKGEAANWQPDVSMYPDCVNGTDLFPYNLVVDSEYHVDPGLAADNGKYYLNGQIGQAVYINKLNPLVMLRKADMTNSSRPVDGAGFRFYEEVEAETAEALTDVITGKSVKVISEVTSGEYVQTQGAGRGEKLAGYVSLGDLDMDGTYYLVEDSVPAGYISPEWKYVKIVLTDTQISWAAYKEDGSIYGSPQSAAKETVDGMKCYTVTILNNPGVALPNTGGPGTNLFYLLGTLLTVFASAGLVMNQRRRNVA